ncbi:MAG: sigma-70 family RNA polymerase sigma factor [Chitinivibrionales bacterium]|nr:sigma-70 family RNA polymerase sigma factor [Chitinivibrionales bacterium]
MESHVMTDTALIDRARSGDRASLGELVRRYQGMVYTTCLRLTGHEADAEDLTHDALVEACLRLGQLRDPARFGGWLRALTLNVFRMWYRKRRLDTVEADEDRLPAEAGDEDAWAQDIVAACLPRLSPEHRIVVALHYLEQLSYDEIATLLDVPIGTVMSRLYRARQRFREHAGGHIREGGTMNPADDMAPEVFEELSVLDEVFRDAPGAAKRFSVLIDEQPERLRQFIAGSNRGDTLDALGALLYRRQPAAVRIALDLALSSDGPSRDNAVRVLGSLVGSHVTPHPRSCGGYPDIHALAFAGLFVDHNAPVTVRAALLLDIMPAAKQRGIRNTLQLVFVSLGDEAVQVAIDRFMSLDGTATSGPAWLLEVLTRSGTPFFSALADRLERRAERESLLALSWAAGAGERLHVHFQGPAASVCVEEHMRSHCVLGPEQVSESAIQRLRDVVAPYLRSDHETVCRAAIRALGALYDTARLGDIRPFLGATAASTRLSAVRAVSDLKDTRAVPMLATLAADRDTRVRVAAIEALAHIGPDTQVELLTRLGEDPCEQVQAAAIVALGEVNTEQTRAVIRRLASAGGKKRRRAAAKALHRISRSKTHPKESGTAHKIWVKLRGESMEPRAFISVGVVLREGIREIRPYTEAEISAIIASLVVDISTTRRRLIEDGFMARHEGVYEFTEMGRIAWRLEQFIDQRYLRRGLTVGGGIDRE